MDKPAHHPELVKNILSGTRWVLILRSSAQAFSWIVGIIVVRFISPSGYGLNAMLEAPLELLMLLSTLGLDAALVRFKKIGQEEMRSAFGWLLVINGLLFLAYFFGGPLLAAYFNQAGLEPLAKALACVFLLVPFRVVPNALLDRELKFKLVASVELVANVASTITILVLAVMGMGVWALVLGVLTNRVIQSVSLMVLQPWIIRPSLSLGPLRRMMAFGGIVAIYMALAVFIDKLASLIAGPLLGSEALGIYNIAMEFAMLPLSKTMPIVNPIMFPSFSKLQGQPALAAYYLERSLGVISLVLFPVMVGMACVSTEFVQTILGEKWLPAATPLALLSLGMPFRAVTYFIRPVMVGMGRIDVTLKSALFMLAILAPLLFVGVNCGIIGLVAAWLVAEPIVTLATIKLSKRVVDVSFKGIYLSLRPAICSTMAMAAGVLWTAIALGQTGSGLLALTIKVGVGAIIYLFVLRVFFSGQFRSAYRLILGNRGADDRRAADSNNRRGIE